jgi:glucose-6-phosphate isomerase
MTVLPNTKLADQTASWSRLEALGREGRGIKISPAKAFGAKSVIESSVGLSVNMAHSGVGDEAWRALCDHAGEMDFERWRDALFAGAQVNNTEKRAVMHMALRAHREDGYQVQGADVMSDVIAARDKICTASEAVRHGDARSASGRRFKHVVNIGIGGSDLGPHCVYRALHSQGHEQPVQVHYVSNVDPEHLDNIVEGLDPQDTLFIVVSKTFTTQETMMNAQRAKEWVLEGYEGQSMAADDILSAHFWAVSTNLEACAAFGIGEGNIFGFWDWVGGRFSLWSSVGLSIALGCGYDVFETLLDGARAMDQHFKSQPLEKNIPFIVAAYGLYHRNFCGAEGHAILPYAQNLSLFPDFLQQLEMESNGKTRCRDGRAVSYKTAPVIFGQSGTNGQHAFYQLLHQGTAHIPCDFIRMKKAHNAADQGGAHKVLNAHCTAHWQSLWQGQDENAALEKRAETEDDAQKKLIAQHSTFNGARPSILIELETLDAHHLGQLIALYEHKTFVQGVLWGLNSFDQWGVQLGKDFAKSLLA